MRVLYSTFVLLSVCMSSLMAQTSIRSKRGILELDGIIKCSTGRLAVSYLGYGCYCGLGGNGLPKDKADWCCHQHDCCYRQAKLAGCQPKIEKYRWTCEDKEAKCDFLTKRCEKMLCNCDREIGNCLKEAPFNKKYADIFRYKMMSIKTSEDIQLLAQSPNLSPTKCSPPRPRRQPNYNNSL